MIKIVDTSYEVVKPDPERFQIFLTFRKGPDKSRFPTYSQMIML